MDTPPPFSALLAQVRRNRWILRLAASPLLLSVAAIVAGLTVKAAFFGFVFHPALIAMAALFYTWRKNPWPTIASAPVRADANGVHVGGAFVPRAEIRDGFVLPGHPPQVRLRRRWALPIELQVGSTGEGRALLSALGLDVSQTVATFRTMSRAVARRRYVGAAVAIFVGLYAGIFSRILHTHHGHHPGPLPSSTILPLGLFFMVSLVAFMLVMLLPTRLRIGADGIVLRWMWRDRFIGYGEIEDVTRYDKGWGNNRQIGVTVRLRSGAEVRIPVGQAEWHDEGVAIIAERMREAMEAFRGGGAAADAALLRRGGRDVSNWVAALRGIGAGANADLRTAPLPRERLFRIVESPTAPAAERAAAAVALGGELDDDARARLQGAAAAIAAPKLRIVLEAAAAGAEQAEVEAALAEVEAEEAKVRRAGAA